MKLRYVLATVLTVALLTAACGSDDDQSGSDKPSEQATTTAALPSTTTGWNELPPCESGLLPDSLPAVLPEPGDLASRCGLQLKISGSCEDGGKTGLAITGEGFTPGGQIQQRAWNVDTGARYFDLANQGVGEVTADGRLDKRPDGTTRTWNCYVTSSNVPDAPGTYAMAIMDSNGSLVLATFTVDTPER